jgi:heat shock protein HslJ
MRMVVVAGLLLALAGCGDEPSASGGSLKGKTYLSTAVTEDGKPKQLVAKTRISLHFTDDGRLIADAGCNSMQSPVKTGGGKLAMDDGLAMTDMGCDGRRHAQDDWLSKVLSADPTWKLDGDRLTVSSGGTAITLQDRETTEPDLALDGTKWTLETVITGTVASHSAGSEKVWITINGERVTGSTGCNELQGPVARDTTKLTFGEIAITRPRPCPSGVATLQTALLNTLEGEVTYEIDANRLKLRASGNGLDFTAIR